ncbi:hypothetical protein [Brevibacillus fortis]|uniref:hypothetical protein n=1 Tax=Brevibacillus fortis TaxID=2126352 RepID=UPI0038FCDF7C
MYFEELKKILGSNDKDKVFMPNEIFVDLKMHLKDSSHIAFAYSYYFVITYLYRNARYRNVIDKSGKEIEINQSELKQILGYSKDNKTTNFIIKQNGILDQMGYTQTVSDFPTYIERKILCLGKEKLSDELYIEMYSDMDLETKKYLKENRRNHKIKYPVKAFYRTPEDQKDSHQNGTFFFVDSTHGIPVDVFIYCMTNKEIGCVGFYLYSYLKRMNDMFEKGYDVPLERLSENTGIKPTTLDKYLDKLKAYNLISCIVRPFVVGKPTDVKLKANTYRTHEFDQFLYTRQWYEKRKVMSYENYTIDGDLSDETNPFE